MPGTVVGVPPGIYNETTNVVAVGVSGGSDTYHTSGPYIYNETSVAVAVGIGGGSDTFVANTTTWNEKNGAIGVGIPGTVIPANGGPFVYNELTSVTAVGWGRSADRIYISELFDDIIAIGYPVSSDTYVPARTAFSYFEFTNAIGVGSASQSETQKTTTSTLALGVGNPSGHGTFKTADGSKATGVGKASVFDRRVYTEHSATSGIGSASSSDRIKAKDRPSSVGWAIPSSSDTLKSSNKSAATGIGRASGPGSAITYSSTTAARGIGYPGSSGKFKTADASKATGVGNTSSSEKLKAREKTTVSGVGVAGQSNQRVLNEKTSVTAVGYPGGTSHATFANTSAAKAIGSTASQALTPNSALLIPAIRYNAAKVLLPLCGPTQIVEALPTTDDLVNQSPPYLVILASKPVKIDLAVQDQAYTIGFDLVLVVDSVANTDNGPTLRGYLRLLEEALLADYQLFGGTSIPSCFDLNIVATPFDRYNEYNRAYEGEGQPVEVAVTSISVSYVEFNQGQ